MELAELFLLAWACVATIFAVHFQHQHRKAVKGGVVLCLMLEALAQGKATIKTHPDGRMTMELDGNEITLREVK